MTNAAHLIEMTHVTARCRREAPIGLCRMRTSVLAPAAVADYSDFYQLPTGDAAPP